jgi:flagellar biogenesis protein FliO
VRIALGCWLVCLLWLPVAAAEERPADAPVPPASREQTRIQRQAAPGEARPVRPPGSTTFSTARVAWALAIVLGAIFALRWASRKMLGLPGGGGASSAVRVLGRSMISPRQQVLLIQVGRRILVVASNGATMSSLCEISDADEVAAILGQASRVRGGDEAGAFSSLFDRASTQFQPVAAERGQEGDAAMDATRAEIGGLLEKVRSLSRAFKRA